MRVVCFIVIAFGILCLIFSLMGRQSFRLHTSTGVYEDAILADQDGGSIRYMTVYGTDDIFIDANAEDQIEFPTKAALYTISVLNIVPMILAYWFLSRVFTNVNKERIFTDQNAAYILYYGLLQIFPHYLCRSLSSWSAGWQISQPQARSRSRPEAIC